MSSVIVLVHNTKHKKQKQQLRIIIGSKAASAHNFCVVMQILQSD